MVAKTKKEISIHEKLIASYVQRGDVQNAKLAAKLAGRELTQSEKRRFLEGPINNVNVARLEALMATLRLRLTKKQGNALIAAYVHKPFTRPRAVCNLAHRQLTPPEVRRAVQTRLNVHQYDEAIYIARSCKASLPTINYLVKTLVQKGETDFAMQAARLGADARTIDCIVRAYLADGRLGIAISAASELKASNRSVERIIRACCANGQPVAAQRACNTLGNRRLTQGELKKCMAACIREGGLSLAEQTAQIRGSTFSKAEQEALIASCIRRGDLIGSRQAVLRAGRRLTPKEIDRLVKSLLKMGITNDAYLAAAQGASKDTIKRLLDNCGLRGDLEGARKAARLLKRDLTDDELHAVYNAITPF